MKDGVSRNRPRLAQEMNAEEAKHFVSGKLFAFNCIDRLRGAGRIYADGSVIGNIQPNGGGAVQPVWLPAGTRQGHMRFAASIVL